MVFEGNDVNEVNEVIGLLRVKKRTSSRNLVS